MKWTRHDDAEETTVSIEGALDVVSAPEVRPTFDAIVAEGRKRVVVDIAAVTLIDSPGVGTLVSLCKRIEAGGGRAVVKGARDQPLTVLKLLKLDRLLA
ncbi:MAG: STAS domain-containing protein [Deltaproteobacteria bacterium]|nr:STAS domain-containing protein [Deltaproteobacteria bacterium]